MSKVDRIKWITEKLCLRSKVERKAEKVLYYNESVLYEHHELHKKDEVKVNPWWFRHQVSLFCICAMSSYSAYAFVTEVIKAFELHCVFYPETIIFKQDYVDRWLIHSKSAVQREEIIFEKIEVDYINSTFKETNKCFIQYFFPLLSLFYAIVWIAIFYMFKSLKKTRYLVVPGIVLISIFALVTFIFQIKYMSGASVFLKTFWEAASLVNMEESYAVRSINNYVNVYIVATRINTIFWILAAGFLFIRLISGADFEYVRVRVELVKLRPEDLPHLSDPLTDSDSSTQDLHKKSLISVLKPGRVHNVIDEEDDHAGKEPTTSRLYINPMTTIFDGDTGKRETEPIRHIDSIATIERSTSNIDVSAASSPKENPLIITFLSNSGESSLKGKLPPKDSRSVEMLDVIPETEKAELTRSVPTDSTKKQSNIASASARKEKEVEFSGEEQETIDSDDNLVRDEMKKKKKLKHKFKK